MGNYLKKESVRCRISSWSRQRDLSQPLRAKTTAAYIASALAKTEAVESGFDEAILLNSQGKVRHLRQSRWLDECDRLKGGCPTESL